ERPGAERRIHRERAALQDRAGGVARLRQHSDVGLYEPRRRREPGPADVPPLPAAPKEDDEAAGPALLRPVRAARGCSRPQLHARGIPEQRHRSARAARPRLRGRDQEGLQRAVDRLDAHRRKEVWRLLERRRVRRPPVHADQLQRQVRRHDDGGARAGAHDAELPLEQGAAVPSRELSDLRRGSGLDVQRGAAHRPHAEDDQGSRHAAVAARQLSRERQGHRVPADAVRRVRASDSRDGRKGRADHRRLARQGVPGDRAQVLRARQRRLPRRRLRAARVGLHPALLSELLRLPVRDVVHRVGRAVREGPRGRPGRDEAVSRVPVGGRIEVCDRSAEGRRRRHDDRRAAAADAAEDEPRDGRNGADSRGAGTPMRRGPLVFVILVSSVILVSLPSARVSDQIDVGGMAKYALAQIDGEIRVPGLKAAVEIVRDTWGVPHISAQSTDDLFFAQGYVMAQDRLWQLEMWRRAGEGRMAEVAGPGAVRRDRAARLLKYRGPFDASEWTSYHPEGRRIFTAYVNGVNAFIAQHKDRLPIEFRVTGIVPEPWTIEQLVLRTPTFGDAAAELQLARSVARLGAAAANAAANPDPPDPLVVPNGFDPAAITDDVIDSVRLGSQAGPEPVRQYGPAGRPGPHGPTDRP